MRTPTMTLLSCASSPDTASLHRRISPRLSIPIRLAVATAVFGSLVSTAAHADCRTSRGWFQLQSDLVTFSDTVSGGSSCSHPSRAGGSTIFTSVSVVSRPRNGTLSASGLRATYTPKSGFKGSDQYIIKVCGNRSGSPGCSTVTYAVTVQ